MAATEVIFTVEESPEGGYEARAIGYSIYTQAETLDELKAMLRDAVRCHFDESDRPRGDPAPPGQRRGPPRLKLPRDIAGDELAALLRRYGYEVTRQTGSHIRLTSKLKAQCPRENGSFLLHGEGWDGGDGADKIHPA